MSWYPVYWFSFIASGVSFFGALSASGLAQTPGCTGDAIQSVILDFRSAQSEVEEKELINELVHCDAQAVPFLIDTLESDEFFSLNRPVLAAIGSAAIPALEDALSSPDELVRERASDALGLIGDEVIPVIRSALGSSDSNVREAAASAILFLDSRRPEVLLDDVIALLETEQDAQVLESAVATFKRFGVKGDVAVPSLLNLFENQPANVRRAVADNFRLFPLDAPAVVPVLKNALSDPDENVQKSAIEALGEYGLDSTEALPELVNLFDSTISSDIRRAVLTAMTKIAIANQRFADTLSPTDQNGITQLEEVEQYVSRVLELSKDLIAGTPIEDLELPHSAIQTKLENLKRDPIYQVFQWLIANPWVILPIAYFAGYLSIFTFRPLWLLRLDEWLPPQTFEVPGLKLKLSLRMLVWLKYHPRVLDTWVRTHRDEVAAKFTRNNTVQDRRIHISMPVTLDGKDITELAPADLKPIFTQPQGCLFIVGEGGAGKTSLACQISKWAMGDDDKSLCGHLLLPILIEQELSADNSLKASIRNQLPLSSGGNKVSDDLLEHLLKKRRVLVIVDHFSEMSNGSRDYFLKEIPALSINALMVTSRIKDDLSGIDKTRLQPMRVQGNRLSRFMDAYLESRDRRNLLEDEEYFTVCRGLTRMVGERDITLLLARLYADQLISTLEGTTSDLPDNIPDLMLSYLNRLNEGVESENRLDKLLVHRLMQQLSWQCLEQSYQPKATQRQLVLDALVKNKEIEEIEGTRKKLAQLSDWLDYLENRLRLIRTLEPGTRLRVTLDPLAEYLAAMALVTQYQDSSEPEMFWKQFFQSVKDRIQEQQLLAKAMQGFLLAVRDCFLLKHSSDIPTSVFDNLEKFAGLDSETRNQAQKKRIIQLLISDLSTLDTDPERVNYALERLEKLGMKAKAAIPALERLLKEQKVQKDVINVLAQVGWMRSDFIRVIQNEQLDWRFRQFASSFLGQLRSISGQSEPTLMVEIVEDKEVVEVKEILVFHEDLGSEVYLRLVSIPGGQFLMGSREEEGGTGPEQPQHEVTLEAFLMGQFPVTQAQWKAVAALPEVNRNLQVEPSFFKGDARPVENVSWNDAVEFCQRLSKKTKKNFHLPTEAQWEYACRAKTTTPFHFGSTLTPDLANYATSETINVASFPANAFGLYDMHGNVWEWCLDLWHRNYEGAPKDASAWLTGNRIPSYILRGGSWGSHYKDCRSATRFCNNPDFGINYIGFRVVCSVSEDLQT